MKLFLQTVKWAHEAHNFYNKHDHVDKIKVIGIETETPHNNNHREKTEHVGRTTESNDTGQWEVFKDNMETAKDLDDIDKMEWQNMEKNKGKDWDPVKHNREHKLLGKTPAQIYWPPALDQIETAEDTEWEPGDTKN